LNLDGSGKENVSAGFIPMLSKMNLIALLPFFLSTCDKALLDSLFIPRKFAESQTISEAVLDKGICPMALKNLNGFLKICSRRYTHPRFSDESYYYPTLSFYLKSVWTTIGRNPCMVDSTEKLEPIIELFRFYLKHSILIESFYFELSSESQMIAWVAIWGEEE
jgi:hypothetical protein